LTAEPVRKVRFTKHARDKFELLRKYGFDISEACVRETIARPDRIDRRDDLLLAVKPLNREYGLRVVHKLVNDNILVITFFPVKRERFGV